MADLYFLCDPDGGDVTDEVVCGECLDSFQASTSTFVSDTACLFEPDGFVCSVCDEVEVSVPSEWAIQKLTTLLQIWECKRDNPNA